MNKKLQKLNFKFRYKFIFKLIFFIIFINTSFSQQQEYVKLFDADITINKDGSLTVTENIEILNAGIKIQHGIHRDFPTIYKDILKNNYIMGFEVKEVLLDGKPEEYTIENALNGKIIKIGSSYTTLDHGFKKYTIKYITTRQLRLNDNNKKDGLYWNVTGNGWPITILHAKASVHLPEKFSADQINIYSYTGALDEKGQNFGKILEDENGKSNLVVFETTDPLNPNEGLTVSVIWPSGFIKVPSIYQKIRYFIFDNPGTLLLLLVLILALALLIYEYLKYVKNNKSGTIIPLFEPPQNMSPGQVRFLYNMKYDSKVFTSEIINMSVQGLIKIDYQEPLMPIFGKGTYTLIKNETQPKDINPVYAIIMDTLFAKKDRIVLDSSNKTSVQIIELAKSMYLLKQPMGYKYVNDKSTVLDMIYLFMIITGLLFLFIYFVSSPYEFSLDYVLSQISYIDIALISIYFILYYISSSSKISYTYTKEGRKLMDQVEGFKLFLTTTESERLKIIGTPPNKTPELYEKYLPYAIALDAEKEWTKQFVPVFEKLKHEGHAYQPIWFIGPFNTFNVSTASQLGSGFTNSINSVIPSSGTPPGWSSGGSGTGGAGRGGGGGGGGGW